MKPIPSYRAAHLIPYIDFLAEIGAPVERELRRAKLPARLGEQPDAYLPLFPTFSFLKEMSRCEGIEELGIQVMQGLTMSDFCGSSASAIYRSPTLRAALAKFRELVRLEDNSISFWLTPGETIAKLHVTNNLPLAPQDQQYEDWNEIMALVAVVRTFAGPAWAPEEIGFRSNILPGRFASEQFSATRFVVGQDTAWITVPIELLSSPPGKLPLPMDSGHTADLEPATHEKSTQEFPASLKRVLAPYLSDGYPEVQFAAELAGTSARTLQRRLRQCNTKYTELVQQIRFEIASRLLRDTDEKIIDIAYEIGYEDPAHFTRAFNKLSGISPSQYRKQHWLQ